MASLIRASGHTAKGYTESDHGKWNGKHCFIFMADPQPGLCDMVENEGKGHTWQKEIDLVKKSVDAINKISPAPKFLCIGGDIINALPDESAEIRTRQADDLRNAFSKLKPSIPVFFVSGNHDVGNVPDSESINWYLQQFGDDYFSFWMHGVFYIVANSQLIYDPSSYEEYAKAQDEWLTKQLQYAKNSSAKHVVFFMHIPIFINQPDEDDFYFNIPTSIRGDLLRKLAEARIEKVFCGHYHRNAGGEWISKEDSTQKIECVVSSAIGAQLGDDISGVRVVEVRENKITHKYYGVDNIPEKVLEDE